MSEVTTTQSGGLAVQGTVASGAVDSGNPVKVGGVVNGSVGTLVAGNRSDLLIGLRGGLLTNMADTITGNVARVLTQTDTLGNVAGITTLSGTMSYNGASWDRLRTPAIFKTATATAAGNTAVWTPTSGKKFRLMGYAIYVTANASLAVAGLEEITFQDATSGIPLGFSIFAPAAAGTVAGASTSGVIQLANGFLSAAANNVLNLNLGTALATGEARVTVWGTEE